MWLSVSVIILGRLAEFFVLTAFADLGDLVADKGKGVDVKVV